MCLRLLKSCILISLLFVMTTTPVSAQTNRSNGINLLRDLFSILFSFSRSQVTTPSNNSPPTTPYPSSSPNNLLPSSQIPPSADQFRTRVGLCKNNSQVYKQASQTTGVDWRILAGIHFLEGGCGATSSLVSGRAIGTNEPDVVRTQGCSSMRVGPGEPIPLPSGGCGFTTLLDSAIYAGRHLIGKIGKIPSTEQELVKALARYNGMGNANCGKTPYSYCPPDFIGDDHIYPMSFVDSKHSRMYLVYCADFTRCNPPRVYLRPGVLTVMKLLDTP